MSAELVASFQFVGLMLILAWAVIIACALWWWALSRVRKCAYETYLLADMRRWMRRHGTPKEPHHD